MVEISNNRVVEKSVPDPVTIEAEFIPTYGVTIDGIGPVSTALIRCRATDLVSFPMKANPRSYNEGGTTTAKIRETLNNAPEQFEVLNRGLTVVCHECRYKEGKVEFKFSSWNQGLVDGGHSFYTAYKSKQENAKVIIKVIYDDGAAVLANKISETFNTCEKVKEMSLNNLKGYFEFIKEEIKPTDYFNDIQWEENAKGKRISCNRIVGILNSLDPKRFGCGKFGERVGVPSNSYNSARHTQGDLAKMFEQFGEGTNNPYYKLKPIIREVIDLFEWTEHNFVRLYNKTGSNYNRLTVTTTNKAATREELHKLGNGDYTTVFYGTSLPSYVPSALIYPIISSMRIFLVEGDDGFYRFAKNPKDIMEEVGPHLIETALDKKRLTNFNTTAIMKEPSFWTEIFKEAVLYKSQIFDNE